MKRYVEGANRFQSTLFPESLEDYIAEGNPVRVVDVFVDELDLKDLGFDGAEPEATGRPSYHPATMLKIYIYGYLNRIQSSRRLERETQRNVELIWLPGRLSPDFKTIADFRRDNGKAIRRVCREFVVLCRSLNLFSEHGGERVTGSEVARNLVEDWNLELDAAVDRWDRMAGGRLASPAKLVHNVVLSMPAGTSPQRLLAASRDFAREEFALQHRYALVLHTDQDHPHVHVVVSARKREGGRLNIRKADLRRWREQFARQLLVDAP